MPLSIVKEVNLGKDEAREAPSGGDGDAKSRRENEKSTVKLSSAAMGFDGNIESPFCVRGPK